MLSWRQEFGKWKRGDHSLGTLQVSFWTWEGGGGHAALKVRSQAVPRTLSPGRIWLRAKAALSPTYFQPPVELGFLGMRQAWVIYPQTSCSNMTSIFLGVFFFFFFFAVAVVTYKEGLGWSKPDWDHLWVAVSSVVQSCRTLWNHLSAHCFPISPGGPMGKESLALESSRLPYLCCNTMICWDSRIGKILQIIFTESVWNYVIFLNTLKLDGQKNGARKKKGA